MAKRVTDESKVFDVSKPGKGKIVPTSRPVITANEIAKDAMIMDQQTPETKAPSASKKVIQPISTIAVEDAKTEDKGEPITVSVTSSASTEKKMETGETESPKAVTVPVKDTAPEPTPEAAPSTSKQETAPETKQETKPESSEAAVVDAVANTANAKKQSTKDAEEQAKRDAVAQELIDSKKYYVELAHDSSKKPSGKHHQWLTILLVLVLTALIGAYLAVDAGIIATEFEVPYDLIRQ